MPPDSRGNDPEHPSSWALRITRRLPRPLIYAPEQVVLNFAFILIGLAGYFQPDGSLPAEWYPEWVSYGWAVAMSFGGAFTLLGLFRYTSTLERAGYILTGCGCLWFGFSAYHYRGLPGVTTAVIFLAIALIKVLRMVLSSAARDSIIERGRGPWTS